MAAPPHWVQGRDASCGSTWAKGCLLDLKRDFIGMVLLPRKLGLAPSIEVGSGWVGLAVCTPTALQRGAVLQAGLPGFYDPCVGEEKNLKVLYQFRGVLHQVMVLDGEALRIPKQCE